MPETTFEELNDVPVSQMVEALASGIARAQFDLDMMSTRIAEMLAGAVADEQNPGRLVDTRVSFGGEKLSLMELGFMPSFYQFVETVVEVKVSISVNRESSSERTEASSTTSRSTRRHGFLGTGGSTTTTRTSSVNARFASRFQYSAEGSSLVRTKIVPVPPPAVLQERMRALSDELQG